MVPDQGDAPTVAERNGGATVGRFEPRFQLKRARELAAQADERDERDELQVTVKRTRIAKQRALSMRAARPRTDEIQDRHDVQDIRNRHDVQSDWGREMQYA